jgi:hypothetical protein
MNADEFNEKYKDYLETDHYGMSIDDPETVEHFDKCFESLTKVNGFKFTQIKLKFGRGRVYTNIHQIAPALNVVVDNLEDWLTDKYK